MKRLLRERLAWVTWFKRTRRRITDMFPPVKDKLVCLLRGNNSNTEKLDSVVNPFAENFVMSGSNAVVFNGIDEKGEVGILDSETGVEYGASFVVGELGDLRSILGRYYTQDGFYVSVTGGIAFKVNDTVVFSKSDCVVEGDHVEFYLKYDLETITILFNGEKAVIEYSEPIINNGKEWQVGTHGSDGYWFNGTVCNIVINGKRFRMAEGEGLICFSDNYETDGRYITLHGTESTMRAGRINNYHGNTVKGFGYRENRIENSNDINKLNLSDEAYVEGDSIVLPYNASAYTDGPSEIFEGTEQIADSSYLHAVNTKYRRMFHHGVDKNGETWWMAFDAKENVRGDVYLGRFPILLYCSESYGVRFIYKSSDMSKYQPKNLTVVKKDLSEIQELGTVVCLGDSISLNYPTHLANLFPTSAIVNAAVGGDTIRMMIDRFQTDVADKNPDKIIILAGANDLAQDHTFNQLKSDMRELLSLCDNTTANEVILGTTTPRGLNESWTQAQQDIQILFNDWLIATGKKVVDQYNHMLEPGTATHLCYNYNTYETDETLGDGVHPTNGSSYNYIAEKFAEVWGFEYPKHIKTEDFTLKGTEKLPFLNDNRGGTFNNSETLYAPATTPVGTFNGVDQFIQLLDGITLRHDTAFTISFSAYNVPEDEYVMVAGNSISNEDYIQYTDDGRIRLNSVNSSAIVYLSGPAHNGLVTIVSDMSHIYLLDQHGSIVDSAINTLSDLTIDKIGKYYYSQYFTGVLRNFNINGKLIPINEGSRYDIHDSLGNVVGTLSGDETFWNGPEMVSDEIIKAEAVQGTKFFTDGNGHPLPMKQSGWEELGEELVLDGNFNKSDTWNIDTGWTIENGMAVSDGTADADISQPTTLIDADDLLECTFYITESTGGSLAVYIGGTYTGSNINSVGQHTVRAIAVDNTLIRFRVKDSFTGKIDNVSVRKVNQVINHNKQYYLRTGTKTELAMYSEVQSDENDTKLLEWITS